MKIKIFLLGLMLAASSVILAAAKKSGTESKGSGPRDSQRSYVGKTVHSFGSHATERFVGAGSQEPYCRSHSSKNSVKSAKSADSVGPVALDTLQFEKNCVETKNQQLAEDPRSYDLDLEFLPNIEKSRAQDLDLAESMIAEDPRSYDLGLELLPNVENFRVRDSDLEQVSNQVNSVGVQTETSYTTREVQTDLELLSSNVCVSIKNQAGDPKQRLEPSDYVYTEEDFNGPTIWQFLRKIFGKKLKPKETVEDKKLDQTLTETKVDVKTENTLSSDQQNIVQPSAQKALIEPQSIAPYIIGACVVIAVACWIYKRWYKAA